MDHLRAGRYWFDFMERLKALLPDKKLGVYTGYYYWQEFAAGVTVFFPISFMDRSLQHRSTTQSRPFGRIGRTGSSQTMGMEPCMAWKAKILT